MEYLFVPFEISLKLKEELGFDESCLALYNKNGDFVYEPQTFGKRIYNSSLDILNSGAIAAPLYQQVIEWIFDKSDQIQILEKPCSFTNKERLYTVSMCGVSLSKPMKLNDSLKEAIKLIKK